MASVIRFSRLTKVAIFTSVTAGTVYLYRDELKPYLSDLNKTDKYKDSTNKVEQPRYIENLPERIPYLLIGGGTASHSAMRAIRGHDAKAKVLIIGGENYIPYMRPALSKELWFTESDIRRDLKFKWWNGKERSIFYEIDEFFIPLADLPQRENGGVSMIKNIRMTHLDPDKRVAFLENGQHISYDKCLLAPGGIPKSLPALDSAPDEVKHRIVYFKTADDFLKLEEIMKSAKRVAIVGGGFLGSELAFALSNRSSEKEPRDQIIYQLYPESGNLAKVLPRHLSDYVSEKLLNEGTKLIPKVEIKSVDPAADQTLMINLSSGEKLNVDYIVCAVGIDPDVELAKSSGLEVDERTGGYLVNSELEARTNVWVAGDASSFYDVKLGRRRVEHHDHAINSGKLAGQNMTGAGKAYTHQSMFWSDLGADISFEAVGIIDSSLPTVSVFADPNDLKAEREPKENEEGQTQHEDDRSKQNPSNDKYAKGVIFYLKDDIIVGILLWNLFNRLTIARRVLNEQKKYDDFKEVAKLFNLYLED